MVHGWTRAAAGPAVGVAMGPSAPVARPRAADQERMCPRRVLPATRPLHRSIAALLLTSAVLLGGACGSGDDANELRIEGDEMLFTAPSETPAGDYRVEFVNVGAIAHELAFTDPTGEIVVRRSIPAGASAELEVELTPGTWTLACHEPGHYEAGMVRDLEVVAAG